MNTMGMYILFLMDMSHTQLIKISHTILTTPNPCGVIISP